MTKNEYKEKLIKLHTNIKENPFRKNYIANIIYGKGYFATVYTFAETFYHLTKDVQKNILTDIDEEDKKLAKVADACLFIHDFYGAINRSENALASYKATDNIEKLDILHEEEELIELCISCIHCYLETGFFYRYPFKRKGKITFVDWNTEKQDYCLNTKL